MSEKGERNKIGDRVRSKLTGSEGRITSVEGGYVEVTYWYAVTTIRQDYFEEEFEKIN